MRLIDADKVDFNEIFMGTSDFAREAREAAQSLIDNQPDIERWIPVEKRLPEEYGSYLVAWIPVGLGIEYNHYYEILEFDPDDEAGWLDRIEQSPGKYEILAWMPLPEQYKAEN